MRARVLSLIAVAVTMTVLDLVFLGVVARGFYDAQLGLLRRPDVQPVAAGLFYAMYVGAICAYAVWPATGWREAARRGAALGFVCYATYELTNWAVLRDWPVLLVPVDLAWGVVLTAAVSVAGYQVQSRVPSPLAGRATVFSRGDS